MSDGQKGLNPLEVGRRLYQRKDYPTALKAFTKVSCIVLNITMLEIQASLACREPFMELAYRIL